MSKEESELTKENKLSKNNEDIIKISHLNKEYKMYVRKKDRLLELLFPYKVRHTNFKAIDDFSLNLKKGEVLGILGKNGAGKSTILKIITGVVAPTSGDIEVKGKISSLLELGIAFNPELTGYENIYQHGQVMGLTNEEIKEKEQEIIDFADIGEHLAQPVKTYSSGMFARLAFACAINVDPDILIVDEVLSVGDIAFQLKCFKKFEEFKNRGKTIIFVTHNIGDIINNCTRSIILSSGKKVFDGGVKEGVEKYKKLITGNAKDMAKISKKGVEGLKENSDEQENGKLIKNNKHLYDEKDTWKSKCNENPDLIEYGNGRAEVIDYGVFDENGKITSIIDNESEITMKSKIIFHEDVTDPIFTMTVKNFYGVEMCGTNTVIERILTGKFKKGEIVIATFKQKVPITPGKYTLSFSCTGFNKDGELEVLNRKYDALLIEIISSKGCVGMLSLNSRITIEREKSKTKK